MTPEQRSEILKTIAQIGNKTQVLQTKGIELHSKLMDNMPQAGQLQNGILQAIIENMKALEAALKEAKSQGGIVETTANALKNINQTANNG